MMRFGRNSEARKVWYRKRKTPKCHFRFCATVNKRRALLPKRGALQVVKTKTCLWYFCGQTRNRRGFYHGEREIAVVFTTAISIFGGLEGDRTLDLCDANAALSQLSYEPILAVFHQKKLRKTDF